MRSEMPGDRHASRPPKLQAPSDPNPFASWLRAQVPFRARWSTRRKSRHR